MSTLILLAIIIVLIFVLIRYNHVFCNCPECVKPPEHMITSNSFARLTRGYNGVPQGGSYHDAMMQLNEAETMNLSNVETDTRSMAGAREPNS